MKPLLKAAGITAVIVTAWAAGEIAANAAFGGGANAGAMVPAFGFVALYVLFDAKEAFYEIRDSLACEIDRRGEEDGEQSERESERS